MKTVHYYTLRTIYIIVICRWLTDGSYQIYRPVAYLKLNRTASLKLRHVVRKCNGTSKKTHQINKVR